MASRIVTGDLLKADVEALVNTVNTQGVMGKGIAAQFKRAYPQAYKAYESACRDHLVRIGKMHLVDLGTLAGGPRWIINFPTKSHWRAKSRIVDIESGLSELARVIIDLRIKSIAVPPLGCGLGGLAWKDVRPKIESLLGHLEGVDVQIFAPTGAPPAEEMVTRTDPPKMTLGRAALIKLMDRYRKGLLDPMVSLLEVHKLMYFLQEAGQPLRLRYDKGTYGPYAKNLRQVLSVMEGHWITGFGDGSDKPTTSIELKDEVVHLAEQFLKDDADLNARMERVAKLIDGFEDAYGLELLSSVHWIMCESIEARDSAEAAIHRVHQWNDRKKTVLKESHLRVAWERLSDQNWGREARSALR